MQILLVSHQSSALRESIRETLEASGAAVEFAQTEEELAEDLAAAHFDAIVADVSVGRERVLEIVSRVCATGDRGGTRVVVAGESPAYESETRARMPYADVLAGFTRSERLLAALNRSANG